MKYGTRVLCNRANTGGIESYEVFLYNFCPFKLPEEIQSGGGHFDNFTNVTIPFKIIWNIQPQYAHFVQTLRISAMDITS